jgi:hypothetical protein
LIQTDNLVNSDIFKIGRTTQHGDTRFINRFRAYPQNSILKCIKEVPSSKVIEIESKIIQIFNIKYQLKNGREWFQGNCLQMIRDIDCIINKYNDSITNTNLTTHEQINISSNKDEIKNDEEKLLIETLIKLENEELVENTNPNNNQYLPESISFKCKKCNKEYNHHSSFSRHKKKCIGYDQQRIKASISNDYSEILENIKYINDNYNYLNELTKLKDEVRKLKILYDNQR